MAKEAFEPFDTSYTVQPPKGSAQGGIDYGKIENIPPANDPLGVLPPDAKQRNIGPSSKE